jgi:Rrf2 family protein
LKFSAQEEYGLRCLMQIAQRAPEECLTIPEISKVEGLSATHVAKLLMILRKEGFITSNRGQTGGYQLSKPADQLYISDILKALGGKLYDTGFCERHSGQFDVCTHTVDCSVRGLWDSLQRAVDKVLDGMTLEDMLQRKHEPVGNVTVFKTPQRAKVN